MKRTPRDPTGGPADGYALIAVLSALLVVTLATLVALHYLIGLHTMHTSRLRTSTALHLAEAGLAKAQWELSRGNTRYAGEQGMKLGGGTVDVDVEPQEDGSGFVVVSKARVGPVAGRLWTCALRAELVRHREGQVTMRSWTREHPGATRQRPTPAPERR